MSTTSSHLTFFMMFRCSSRGPLCVFVVLGSQRGRAWSGTGLARLVWGRDWASLCSQGWVVQVTGLSRTGWSVSMSDWVLGWRGCRWGLVCFTRHEPHWKSTRTTRTHATHCDTLSLSSCKHSIVSRFLSVVSLISCLSCVSCLVSLLSCLLSVLFCFCHASILSLCCLVLVFPLFFCRSVCVCLCLSVSVCVCLCLSVPCVCLCDLCLRRAI